MSSAGNTFFKRLMSTSIYRTCIYNLFALYGILESTEGGGDGDSVNHRRRIELEDKAKVVTPDWGTESLPR